jgi:hypothetical protein
MAHIFDASHCIELSFLILRNAAMPPPSVATTATDRKTKQDVKLRVGQAFMKVVKCESLRDKWLTASCLLRMI